MRGGWDSLQMMQLACHSPDGLVQKECLQLFNNNLINLHTLHKCISCASELNTHAYNGLHACSTHLAPSSTSDNHRKHVYFHSHSVHLQIIRNDSVCTRSCNSRRTFIGEKKKYYNSSRLIDLIGLVDILDSNAFLRCVFLEISIGRWRSRKFIIYSATFYEFLDLRFTASCRSDDEIVLLTTHLRQLVEISAVSEKSFDKGYSPYGARVHTTNFVASSPSPTIFHFSVRTKSNL